MSYIELARTDGGTIHCGGEPPRSLPERCRGGSFVEPAVITGLPVDSRVNREEIFGPVVTVTPFRDAPDCLIGSSAVRQHIARNAAYWPIGQLETIGIGQTGRNLPFVYTVST